MACRGTTSARCRRRWYGGRGGRRRELARDPRARFRRRGAVGGEGPAPVPADAALGAAAGASSASRRASSWRCAIPPMSRRRCRARDGINALAPRCCGCAMCSRPSAARAAHARTIVHYEDLVAPGGWRRDRRRGSPPISASTWPARARRPRRRSTAFLAPELRHHRAGAGPSSPAGSRRSTTRSHRRSPACRRSATRCRRELDRAGELFLPLLGETVHGLADSRAQRQAQDRVVAELAASSSRAQHEAAELRELRAARRGRDQDAEAAGRRGHPRRHQADAAARRRRGLSALDRWPRDDRASAGPTGSPSGCGLAARARCSALGMIVPAGSETIVALTLRSLCSQIAGDWLLHVVAEARRRPRRSPPMPRLVWHARRGASGRATQSACCCGVRRAISSR